MLELDTNLLAELGGWPALKEARSLLERGKVSEARRDGAVIQARVQGTDKIYEPRIMLADRISSVDVRCTCVEWKRTGRVCAHILAAGLAQLQPRKGTTIAPSLTVPVAKVSDAGRLMGSVALPSQPPRWILEEAPTDTPGLTLSFLLPLQLPEALGKDTLRLIVEAQRGDGASALPFDAALRGVASGYAVSGEDERALCALEGATGTAAGVNEIARARTSLVLQALAGHPRVWLGKKERITIVAAAEQPRIDLATDATGALLLDMASDPATPNAVSGWSFASGVLRQTKALPPGFISTHRMIARDRIPEFLTQELPALERAHNVVFAEGADAYRLDVGHPQIEARIDGALSGLTLELSARYEGEAFALLTAADATTCQRYYPDVRRMNRFWRRNEKAEVQALALAEAAGFRLVRAGATAFSLSGENNVARFLANALPPWRREWLVTLGSRLEATMLQVDLAQPEFSFQKSSGEDWLSLDLKLTVNGQPVALDPSEIQRWLQTGQSHTRTANKRILLVPTEAWSEMREVLADCDVAQTPGEIRVGRASVPFLAGALTAQGFQGTAARETAVPLQEKDLRSTLDETLWAVMRPYQTQGVAWLGGLAAAGFHGLLADDMGLGKTLQALAFFAWLKATRQAGAALIVCPTSLVTNWLREAARFTPQLRTLDLTGADRAEKWARRKSCDLLVTSYAILRRDAALYREQEFSLAVLDEAQHIKNRGSQNAQAAKTLRAQYRLILTGTPLENSVLDLWSLFDFLIPGYLGSASDFRERYENPLAKGPASAPRVLARLRHRVRPFFLRRTKDEVLRELPPKLEIPTLCELSDEQREVYRAVLAQGRRDVFDRAGKAGQGRDRIAVLTTLLRLRQVCCHLDLLPAGDTQRVWKEPSAKRERTFELIDEAIDGGHRVLLFSQFVRVLHLLRDEAQRRELSFCYLDGQTVRRQEEIDRFQQDGSVPLFFISLKAGGTGLNLTGADTVIHFDPWWNPAVEEQATARAHRLGQSRRVQAYKLIAAGTVEEKIQALQTRKRELFDASLASDEAMADKLTGDDLEDLLAE